MSRSADTSDIANIKKAKPETNHKKALHFGVLIGLVVLVFGLDQLLFGTLGSFQTTSLKEFFGSAADLFVGAVLALAALQAYLWQSKSPRAPDGAKTAGGASSRGDLLKAAQVSLNRDLDRAFQKGCETKRLVRLLQKFETEWGLPDALSYNLVLRAHAKDGNCAAADGWMKYMEEKGKATLCSYNTMLDACSKAGDPQSSESWLQRLLDGGLRPNVISFATVIHAFARKGDETRAQYWQSKMLEMGVEPDTVSYNSLIHACGVKGNIQAAEGWLEDMLQRQLPASVTTFASLIDACAKAGDLERAEKWMQEMLQRGIEPNVVSFGAVINACAKASNLQRAEYWHHTMLEMGVTPNVRSYSSVINACAKAGKAEEAVQWLERLEDAGLQSDAIVYSSVIDACGKAGDTEMALCIFRRMQARGIQPHVVTYSALARPFAYKGHWQEVEDLAVEMEKSGQRPNEYFIYAQLLAYATAKPKEPARAERCIRNALEAGLVPNQHILSGLGRALGRKRATDLLAMLGHKVPFG